MNSNNKRQSYTLINNFNQQSLLDSLGRYQKSKNKLKTWLTSKTNDALFLTKKKYFEKFLKYLGWIKIKHVECFSDYFPKYTLNRFYMIMIFLWIIAWLWSSGTGNCKILIGHKKSLNINQLNKFHTLFKVILLRKYKH